MRLDFLQTRYLAPGDIGIASRGAAAGQAIQSSEVPRHGKQVIGYITQYDGWKEISGVVPKNGYNHLNVDYSKYTIINFSFFGLAKDGSLHSADYRNKEIHIPGKEQDPAPLLHTDVHSSFDLPILFGELEDKWSVNWSGEQIDRAWDKDLNPLPPGKYEPDGDGWINKIAGVRGGYPIKMPGTVKGLLTVCKEHGVKCMASLGGWSMSKHFGDVAADPVKRKKLMEDCRKLIDMGFDGIDVDWEYPGAAGMNFTGKPEDYANFSVLMDEIRDTIGQDKLITAAFSAATDNLKGFDWRHLAEVMDYFNMMTYDMNGGFSAIAGHNAPLYNYPGAERALSLDELTTWMLAQGIPASKINLGAPFYGRGVITKGPAGLNVPTKMEEGVDLPPDGPVTSSADLQHWTAFQGTPFYSYILHVTGKGGWQDHWDDHAKVPYMTKDNYFLSYDNERSIKAKAQYIVEKQLAGVIIWTVFGDMLNMTALTQKLTPKLTLCPQVTTPLAAAIDEVFSQSKPVDKPDGNPVDKPTPAKRPQVKLIAPVNDAQFKFPAKIALSAEATDENGKVTEVTFFQGNQEIGKGVATGNIWNFTWANVPAGVYSLRAEARNDKNMQALSTAAKITVTNQTVNYPPLVRLTAPTNNEQCKVGDTVILMAQACDSDCSTPVVTFVASNLIIGESRNRPFTIDWKPGKPGNYKIWAKATDAQRASSYSEMVTFTVTETQVQLPGVTLIAPEDGKQFSAPAKVTLEAAVTAPAGTTISKVELYDGATLLTVVTRPPYSYALDIQASGTYTFTAKVTDSKGQTATSEPVSVSVSAAAGCTDQVWDPVTQYQYHARVSYNGKLYQARQWNQGKNPEKDNDPNNKYWDLIGPCGQNTPPQAFIKRPANDTVFNNGPLTLEIEAEASVKGGSIQKVSFYLGTSLLGEVTSAPYVYKWANVPPGKYQVVAKALDDKGATGESAMVSFSVEAAGENLPPEVTLLSPSNGQEFKSSDVIPIKVKAVDPEGTITQVDIYNGATYLQKLTQEPYIFNWKALPGTHTIRVEALDDHNHTGSAQVIIKVLGTQPPSGNNPIEDLLLPEEWDRLFPHRYNPDDWRFEQGQMVWTGSTLPKPENDFFSYNNFVEAIKRMDHIRLFIERHCGTNISRISWIGNYPGGKLVVHEDPEFQSNDMADKPIVTAELDYATFLREGDLSARKRELAAFLANISHETTGASENMTAQEQSKWGLFWREEVGHEEWRNTAPAYRVPNDVYPPSPGKSYHGRGPIQLSYNYNYGAVSEILFSTKSMLLDYPEKVLQEGTLAFQTAIWFWMTPQYPKPSCHDVMIPGKWQPTDQQALDNIQPGFGATILIINGGLECNGNENDKRVVSRLRYYSQYVKVKGVTLELNGGNDPYNCGCAKMKQFASDVRECSEVAALFFDKPAKQVIDWNGSSEIEVVARKNDPKGEISEISVEIDGKRHPVSGAFMWRPAGYGTYTGKLIGNRDGKSDVIEVKTFTIWNRNTGEGFSSLPEWASDTVYEGGQIVQYKNKAYSNQWWAGPVNGSPATPPDQDTNWIALKFS